MTLKENPNFYNVLLEVQNYKFLPQGKLYLKIKVLVEKEIQPIVYISLLWDPLVKLSSCLVLQQ